MKKGKINFLNLLIGVAVILYAFFGTDFLKNVKQDTKNMKANIKKIDTKKVVADGNLKVTFIDVGQADSILIECNNHNMLIDAGNNEDGEKLASYLKKQNINHFDYVFATHPHEDHIGGMDDIIKQIKIDNFYMPDVITTTRTFEDVLDALEEKGIYYQVPDIDEEMNLSDAIIKVLYVGNNVSNLNESSVVLKLEYGNISFLLTGDATSEVENKIIDKNLKSEVLKVGHHGSNYSTSDDFLKKVSPKYAVISVGKNNVYKHPSNDVLNKLEKTSAKIYRTDEKGSIIFTSDGNNIEVTSENTDTNG